MKLRLIALSVIAFGAIVLARPVHANVDPPPIKICVVDMTGDGTADSWCMGRNGCFIGPDGCHAW